jgi:hypothetical protein
MGCICLVNNANYVTSKVIVYNCRIMLTMLQVIMYNCRIMLTMLQVIDNANYVTSNSV